MGDYALISLKGRLTDKQFQDPAVCLVAAINATSYKLTGVAKDLSEVYDHANLFENRRQLHNLNRVIRDDRPYVGSLVIKEGPEGSKYPTVVGMVTQFGQGDSVEYNRIAKYYVETSRDVHYVDGLIFDTKDCRRDSFRSCLNHLLDYVIKNKNIRRVVLPAGIGRRGKMDHEWHFAYLKELRSFAHQLDLNSKEVVLLEQDIRGGENSDTHWAARVDGGCRTKL